MNKGEIYGEILVERVKQDRQWGPEHDKVHTLYEWADLAQDYLIKAQEVLYPNCEDYEEENVPEAKHRLIQAGALIFAGLEASE